MAFSTFCGLSRFHSYYAPPLIGGGIKRCFCLTSACLSCTSGLSREQRCLWKTKIDTELAYVTRDSDTTFKVKGQGHQAALLSAALTRKATACSGEHGNVFGVGKNCYVASARWRARPLGAHGGGEGRGILCRHAHSLFKRRRIRRYHSTSIRRTFDCLSKVIKVHSDATHWPRHADLGDQS